MKKTVRFLEFMWLFIMLFCFIISGVKFFQDKMEDSGFFLIFGVAAFFLYLLRKKQRKKL